MYQQQAVERDQRQPLLLGEEESFVSYDDDDLAAAARLRKKRASIRICVWAIVGVLLIALVGVGIYFGSHAINTAHKAGSSPLLGKYKQAAVASDVTQCSQIGRDILKSGGNAVDAAIAALLCMGLTDPQSMGIGGGFFMTVYNKTTGESYAIDAREVAPIAATTGMFYNGTSSSKGVLAIAVPGELKGYQLAHERFGTLPWATLFQPAIDMAKNGFKVPGSLDEALNSFYNSQGINSIAELKERYPVFSDMYVSKDSGGLYKEGEVLKLPAIAATLETLATEGAVAFYNGSLTKSILADITDHDSGAIITKEDLLQYKPSISASMKVTLRNDLSLYTPQAPSGGAILMFILNILGGFNMTAEMLKTTDGTVLAYHRITEAFKFAYAKRTSLGDPKFIDIEKLLQNLTSRDYADYIRTQIWDNQTHPYEFYGATYYDQNKTSTAHLSVVDQFGNAVSVTSTVNFRFGSNVFGSRTGIIFNNEMDDFATSNKPNDWGIYPSPANQIKPGKRPLSSMCPAIFVDKDGDARLVVGAAGGSRITTATAFVAARVLWFDNNIQEAIDALRIHHQLLPPEISYETGIKQEVIDGLKAKGHNVTAVSLGKSIVQGIHRVGSVLYANSDLRKGGTPAGF